MESNFEKPAIKKIVITLATNYGVALNESQLNTWLAILSGVTFNSLSAIALEIMRDSSIVKLPLPAQVREYALAGSVPPADRDIGNEVAGLIWDAISKFGHYQESEAKNYIGELGWLAVQRLGGWNNICQVENVERGTFFAQARDQIEALQRLARKGQLNKTRDIPRLVGSKMQNLLEKSVKEVPKERT